MYKYRLGINNISDLLLFSMQVEWVQQQQIKKRVKRHIRADPNLFHFNDPIWSNMWYLVSTLLNAIILGSCRVHTAGCQMSITLSSLFTIVFRDHIKPIDVLVLPYGGTEAKDLHGETRFMCSIQERTSFRMKHNFEPVHCSYT